MHGVIRAVHGDQLARDGAYKNKNTTDYDIIMTARFQFYPAA